MRQLTEREHFVYAAFSESNCCLYVGRSVDPKKRWMSHRAIQKWAAETVRIDVWGPFTMQAAIRREAEMIRDLWPAHNHARPLAPHVTGKHLSGPPVDDGAWQQAEIAKLSKFSLLSLEEIWLVVNHRRVERAHASAYANTYAAMSDETLDQIAAAVVG